MSKARGLADLGNVYNDGALSNRNLIINGAMQVAQRGTSVAGVTSSGYKTCDRFTLNLNALATWTVSQSADAPAGFASSLMLECTTADAAPAANSFLALRHVFEGQNLQQLKKGTAAALPLTLSFWVKCFKTGDFQVNLNDADNGRQLSSVITINSAATWEYKTATFAGDTVGAFNNDNERSMDLEFWLDVGSTYTGGAASTSWETIVSGNRAAGTTLALGDSTSNYFQITGVQLEVGDTATPFEHRSYGQELALCQRYYERLSAETDYSYIGVGVGASATIAQAHITYQKKRAIPSLSGVGDFMLYSGYDATVSNVTFVHITSTRCTGYFYSTGLTVGRAYKAQFHAAGDRYIAIDAEL